MTQKSEKIEYVWILTNIKLLNVYKTKRNHICQLSCLKWIKIWDSKLKIKRFVKKIFTYYIFCKNSKISKLSKSLKNFQNQFRFRLFVSFTRPSNMCNNFKSLGAFSDVTSFSLFHHYFQNYQNFKTSFKLLSRTTYQSLEVLYIT